MVPRGYWPSGGFLGQLLGGELAPWLLTFPRNPRGPAYLAGPCVGAGVRAWQDHRVGATRPPGDPVQGRDLLGWGWRIYYFNTNNNRRMGKGHKGTFQDDKSIHLLDHGDGYTGV